VSGEEQYISFCFRYVFAGANLQAGFALALKKMTAASPDKRAIYD
jgi:hypothetical protein